jgi:hypothetical protein
VRMSSPRSRARLFTLVADRILEAALMGALAWTQREIRPTLSALALIGLGVSSIAAYERARGRALGYRVGEGAAYALIRYGLIAAALVTTRDEVLWAFVALVTAAAVARAWGVAAQERRARAAATGGGG